MRILVLTLILSFLSHSAFGAAAAEGGGASAAISVESEWSIFALMRDDSARREAAIRWMSAGYDNSFMGAVDAGRHTYQPDVVS